MLHVLVLLQIDNHVDAMPFGQLLHLSRVARLGAAAQARSNLVKVKTCNQLVSINDM